MGDRIEVRGLRVLGVIGVLPEEQERAQPFEIDLDVVADLALAGASDALADTVDYGAVVAAAERVVATERHELLEAVAQRVADEVLAQRGVRGVSVTVRKLRPPLPQDVASTAVHIERGEPA
jgi:dihydroneopterin aldolase